MAFSCGIPDPSCLKLITFFLYAPKLHSGYLPTNSSSEVRGNYFNCPVAFSVFEQTTTKDSTKRKQSEILFELMEHSFWTFLFFFFFGPTAQGPYRQWCAE